MTANVETKGSAHTPGPWVRLALDDWGVDADAGDGAEWITLGPDGADVPVCLVTARYHPDPLSEPLDANARLIAAAPDLLATLQEISRQYENVNVNHVDFRVWAKQVSDAAIAKALTEDKGSTT